MTLLRCNVGSNRFKLRLRRWWDFSKDPSDVWAGFLGKDEEEILCGTIPEEIDWSQYQDPEVPERHLFAMVIFTAVEDLGITLKSARDRKVDEELKWNAIDWILCSWGQGKPDSFLWYCNSIGMEDWEIEDIRQKAIIAKNEG